MNTPLAQPDPDFNNDDSPAFLVTDDSWIEGMWTLGYWTPNYDDRDPCNDGTNRIVKTVPCEVMVRVSLMAMLYRRTPEDSLTLTQRFRYWGSADPGGKDDYLYCEHWGVSDPETAADLAEFIQSQTIRMHDISQALSLCIVDGEELRYTPVQGNNSRFLEVIRGLGFAATPTVATA